MSDSKMLYWLLAFASVVIIIAGLIHITVILLPFLLAVFFSILLSPVQSWLMRLGLPKWLALIVIIINVIVVVVFVVDFFTQSIVSFLQNSEALADKLRAFIEKFGGLLPVDNVDTIASLVQPATAITFVSSSMQTILATMNSLFIVVMLAIFMLIESDRFRTKIVRLCSPDVARAMDSFRKNISHYMLYKTLLSFVTGMIIGFGLWLIDIEYAALWGLLAFLLNYIPNVGSIIAAVIPLVLSVITHDMSNVIFVALLYISVNLIIGNVIEPKVMGQGMGLSALVVFTSVLFWGWVFGVVGMFLAIPLTMMMKIALQSSQKYKHFGEMLDS